MAATQRYFIELAFDGTHYHGWQVQQNAITVQEILNKALSVFLRQPIETTGCGRTDTGVHARQLYAHFDCTPQPPEEESTLQPPEGGAEVFENKVIRGINSLFRGLGDIRFGNIRLGGINSLLPCDIAVKNIILIHPEAHARFDATQRSYEYHIHFNKDPFKTKYSWLVKKQPDMDLMNRAAGIIKEYTDFSCFSKSNTQVATNNCKITRAEWVETVDGLVFYISADRFLRNMVRAIVGTLIMVGKKEITPEKVRDIIESKNRSNAGASVPACGLFLTEIKYPYPLNLNPLTP